MARGANARTLPFTEEQMRQVFDTNIIDFAIQHGFEVEKGDRNTVHVKQSGGLFLFKSGRGFYCFTSNKKGNIIDFTKEYLGATDFKEAVELILGCRAYELTEHYVPPVEKKERGELVLPPKDSSFMQTIDYLERERGIDSEILAEMIKTKKVYGARTEKNGRSFHNCAFVGYDETGKARYCALRSPSETSKFRQDVQHSDKTYGFTMEGKSNRIYEFEAPIDAMSHATLCKLYGIDWREDHRVSEGCLSDKALQRYLQNHPEIDEIVFCYDNDMDGKLPDGSPHNHGQVRAEEYALLYQERGYRVFIQTPQGKDFNQDLTVYLELVVKSAKEIEEVERG
ncbi:MAG: DUF3991 domain-containing protein [Lachnospiraceae bacterium]